MSRNDPVTIPGARVVRATDDAILVAVEGGEHWIPRSQLDDDCGLDEVDDEGDLIIPEWLADDRGLG